MSASKPKIEAKGAKAAMTQPPGTPGAATMQMARTRMKWRKSGRLHGMPLTRQMVRAQQVIFIIEPAMWMVAHSGTVKPAMPSFTPFFNVCLSVTGMAAADDEVPRAVK